MGKDKDVLDKGQLVDVQGIFRAKLGGGVGKKFQ